MKMLCCMLVLMGLVAFVTGAATYEYKGDHYENLPTPGYAAPVWNYDYTHTVSSGACKDSSSSTVTCSTSTKCGPACWGVAGGTSNKCSGSNQTPINLVAAEVDPDLDPPEFIVKDGGCAAWTQFGDDHAFEVSFSEKGKECTNLQLKYKGTLYTLAQFHFHAPSEHTIASGLGAAELHMVHKAADGSLLVLGVIMQVNGIPYGGGNQFLKKFWKAANSGYAVATATGTGALPACSASSLCTNSGTATASSTTVGTTTTYSVACSTTSGQSASVLATGISAGDVLSDTSGVVSIGTTVVSVDTTNNKITISKIGAGTGAAAGAGVKFFPSASSLIKSSCNPSDYVTAREAAFSLKTATSTSGLCKYAFEYEVAGADVINPYTEFLPADKSFYTYSGSLTTYPCTEGVTWIVFEQPMMVSTADVTKIMASAVCEIHSITKFHTAAESPDGDISAHADNRPLQSLGTRKLYKYDHAADLASSALKETAVAIAAIVLGSVGLVVAGGAIGYSFAGKKGLDFAKTAPAPAEDKVVATA